MKKIILYVLLTILVVVAGAGGYFTFKYFDLKNDQDDLDNQTAKSSVMTISEAKTLINKVSSDMGFLTTNSALNTSSISYDDYNGEEIDYAGKEDFIKAFVLAAKFAFDGEIKEETYYVSKASYSMGGTSYHGIMKMFFTLRKNELELHLFDENSNAEVIIKINNNSNAENDWTMYMYSNVTFYGHDGALYVQISADSNKVNEFGYSQLTFTTKPTKFEDLSDANINTIEIYDCDKTANKILNVSKSDMTSDEILEYSKKTIEKVNKQVSVNFTDLHSYTEINFLKLTYEYLGYNVVN